MEMIKATKKTNYKKSGAAAAHKIAKRSEAEARQAAYSKLSFEDKLARQKPGGKVFNKLMAQKARTKGK